jgi:VWFA-related protein
LIDTSSSQARYPLFKPGLQALSDFVDSALKGPQDKVFFVTFNVTPDGTGFMSREESQTQKPKIAIRGGTALYDAVYMACKDRIQDDDVQPARRVLLVFSDGEDNQSHVTRSAAIVAAGESGTMIFTVSISNVMGETRGDIVLKEFAKSTGGDAFLGVNARSLPKVLTSIREKIEEMYVATYVPADAVGPGRIHTVAFKVASEKKLKVQAPEGY